MTEVGDAGRPEVLDVGSGRWSPPDPRPTRATAGQRLLGVAVLAVGLLGVTVAHAQSRSPARPEHPTPTAAATAVTVTDPTDDVAGAAATRQREGWSLDETLTLEERLHAVRPYPVEGLLDPFGTGEVDFAVVGGGRVYCSVYGNGFRAAPGTVCYRVTAGRPVTTVTVRPTRTPPPNHSHAGTD